MNERQPASGGSESKTTPLASAGDIVCAGCQRTNRSNSQFCSACGESLWADCPACNARCAASEAFCGVCGANRSDVIEAQTTEIENARREAEQLATQCEFDRAIATLQQVAAVKQPQLTQYTRGIQEQIDSLKQERDRLLAARDSGLARARQLLEQHEYAQVIAELDRVAPPLRTPELGELLTAARARNAEVSTLVDEIREAAAAQRYLDLAPAVDQLLTLQPNHRLGLSLAQQLRERFCRKARRKLSEYHYDEALTLLNAIPAPAQDAETAQLVDHARELIWVFDDLRSAPVVTPTVLRIAQRLAKAVPGDKRAVAIHEKLTKLGSQPSTNSRFPHVAWAPRPKTPQFECPVNWLAGFRTMRAARPEAKETLNRYPGRFFAAAGLALEGLDVTEIKAQLRPPERQGVLGKLAVGQRKQQVLSAWGLDLGESSLKAVRLVRDAESGAISIDAAFLLEHATLVNPADAVGTQHDMAAETLARLRDQVTVDKADRVCVNLPSQNTLGRFLKLPQSAPKKLAELVKFEASSAIPCPLEELVLEHHAFPPEGVESDKAGKKGGAVEVNLQDVLLVAAKRSDIRERLRVFAEAGFHVDLLQSDAIAFYNFALHDCLGPHSTLPTDPAPLAILDVGTRATNLIVSSPRGIWFRTLRFGGVDFTESILRPFKLTFEQAEQVKRQPTRARSVSRLYRELDAVLARFAAEVQRSLAAYEKDNQGPRVAKIVGTGGGFLLHGLLRRMAS